MKKASYDNDEYALRASVYPFGTDGNDWQTTIEVTRHRDLIATDTMQEASVNWPAIGSQPPRIVEDFAEGLLMAVQIAKEFNNPVFLYEVQVTIKDEEKSFTLKKLGNSEDQVRKCLEKEHVKDILYIHKISDIQS